MRPRAVNPLRQFRLELRDRVTYCVLMKHFALKAVEYFPFEVILSDVQ